MMTLEEQACDLVVRMEAVAERQQFKRREDAEAMIATLFQLQVLRYKAALDQELIQQCVIPQTRHITLATGYLVSRMYAPFTIGHRYTFTQYQAADTDHMRPCGPPDKPASWRVVALVSEGDALAQPSWIGGTTVQVYLPSMIAGELV